MKQILDLSVALSEQTPVYPGDEPLKIKAAGVMDRDGLNDHVFSMNAHTGTHIDAPWHMIADGKRLGQLPIDSFVGRGWLIAKFDLASLQQADIHPGDIVLFRTGMSEHYDEPRYFQKYPVMSEEIAHYLVGKKVKMVGVDAGSVDDSPDFPIHKILLVGGVLVIENLTRLDQLADKAFTVYALPIKLDLDGAPARVIAEIEA